MRKDQKDFLSKETKYKIEKIMLALFPSVGVEKLEDVLPDVPKFISDLVDKSFECFSEKELDEIISFNLKYTEKFKWSEEVGEQFASSYMENNAEEVEQMIIALQGK